MPPQNSKVAPPESAKPAAHHNQPPMPHPNAKMVPNHHPLMVGQHPVAASAHNEPMPYAPLPIGSQRPGARQG